MLAQHCSALQKVKPDGRDLTMQHKFPMHSAIPFRGPHPQQLYAPNNATSSPLCPDQASFALCVCVQKMEREALVWTQSFRSGQTCSMLT